MDSTFLPVISGWIASLCALVFKIIYLASLNAIPRKVCCRSHANDIHPSKSEFKKCTERRICLLEVDGTALVDRMTWWHAVNGPLCGALLSTLTLAFGESVVLLTWDAG